MSLVIRSGPPSTDLPYRYGCQCGAIWNASRPLGGGCGKALCGPYCVPVLSPLDEPEADR